jgi:hypothetical protein
MRVASIAAIILISSLLAFVSFHGGRLASRRAQTAPSADESRHGESKNASEHRADVASDDFDHILVANVATVSFGELWDVVRSATAIKRAEWATQLEQLAPGPKKNAAIKSFFKIWSELDPDAAISGVEGISDKRMRDMAFVALADAAADSALPNIAELEFRLGRRSSQFSQSSVLARWADADPPSAARFLKTHANNDSGHFLNATYGWAHTDPEKAAEWLLNLKLPALQNPKYPRQQDRRRLDAARGLFEAWLEKDSRAAAVFAASHADDPDINKALGEFTGALFTKSHDDARAFLLSLRDEGSQRAALEEINKYINGELVILREGGDDEEPNEQEIPAKDVPAWLVALPRNLWVDRVGDIFVGWEHVDSPQADAWLRSLPTDLQRQAIAQYCNSASLEDAPRVFQLTTLLKDAALRNQALQSFLGDVASNEEEPEELHARIAALNIPDQQKRLLHAQVRKHR